jgi:hypothetical protein
MKVEVLIPGPIDAKAVKVTEQGITITPLFYRGRRGVAFGPVVRINTDDGQLIGQAAIKVSKQGVISLEQLELEGENDSPESYGDPAGTQTA